MARSVAFMVAVLAVPFLTLACSDDERAVDEARASPTGATTTTEADLISVAEQVFPLVEQYDYYIACDSTGDASSCPITDRLRSRLADPGTPPPDEAAINLCRGCQNPSDTRNITAEVDESGGGTAHVEMYGGNASYDLIIVPAAGKLLVDDQECTVGGPSTSLYADSPPTCSTLESSQ